MARPRGRLPGVGHPREHRRRDDGEGDAGFQEAGLSFIFSDNWDPNAGEFGALAFIYGSVVISLIALIIAVPVSVGIALFVTEVAPRRLRSSTQTVLDLLAAIPSVVFGLIAFIVLRPPLKDIYNSIADAVADIPVLHTIFGPSQSGMSFMTAALILALMITPIITSITREVLSTVPDGEKGGALASARPMGDDPGCDDPALVRRDRRSGHARPRSGPRRDHRRGAGDRCEPPDRGQPVRPGEAMPSVIARNLNESAGTYQAALIAWVSSCSASRSSST